MEKRDNLYEIIVHFNNDVQPFKMVTAFPVPKRIAELVSFEDVSTGKWYMFNAPALTYMVVKTLSEEDDRVQKYRAEVAESGRGGKKTSLDIGLGSSGKGSVDNAVDVDSSDVDSKEQA